MIKALMKIFILLILSWGCTQKYVDYDLIKKVSFNRETFERPIPVTQVAASGKDTLSQCFNQWLFFSNAEKEKNQRLPEFIRALCPGKDYLVQTEVKELWWTSILFTQSCVDIKTLCGVQRVK